MYSPVPQRADFCDRRVLRIFWIKILCLSFLSIVSLSPNVYAQPSTNSSTQLCPDSGHRIRFNHITDKQGLSHNSVYDILQDSKGFMWFGTYVGLCKYDGYKFTVYKHDPEDPHSLSHNAVVALWEDQSGILWVGTVGGGLNAFDRNTEQFTHYQHDSTDPHSLSHNDVWAIYEDHTGGLWVGTGESALNKLDRATGQFTHYQIGVDEVQGMSRRNVRAVYEDRTGELWIGTAYNGLNRFDRSTERFTTYRHDPDDPGSLSHHFVSSIYEDHLGNLWIGTEGGGLNQFHRDTGRFSRYRHDPNDPYSVSSDKICAIHEDQSGQLWVATIEAGVNRFDSEAKRFIRYQYDPANPQSLNDNNTRSLYVDRSGGLWVGTKAGGINILDRRAAQFGHYQHVPENPQSLNNNTVYALCAGQSGEIWIGTQHGGLNKFDPNTGEFIHYQYDPDNSQSLSDNYVRALYEDRSGVLWIGMVHGGLNRFDPQSHQEGTEQFVHYQHNPDDPASLSHNYVSAIYEDREGILWIGTHGGGLNKFDRTTEQFISFRYNPENSQSLSGDRIRAIHEDHEGVLWIGTTDGLNKFDRDTGQFVRYQNDPSQPQSLSHSSIKTIYEDRAHVLWIGTAGGGFNTFDRATGTFTHYREKDGLPNDTVYGILEDEQGNLWLSTNQGISKFNPRTKIFKNYNESDGLQGNEFNTNAYCKTRDGMMLFGGFNGFNAFYPDDITDNPYVPPVVITDFQLFHKAVPIGENSPLQKVISETNALTLSYKDFIFSFTFAALNYVSPEENRYAYKMEGFDKDWHYADSKHRHAVYTNLDPGSYVFRVNGSNNDGVWNDEGASITITITPPWWETWWFRGFALICVIGMAFTAYRVGVRTLESRKRQLELQVVERTQELQQEIEERKRAEGALQKSEDRLKSQYKGIPIPTYTWQMQGDALILIDYNDAAEVITKGMIQKFIGQKPSDIHRDRPEIIADLKTCYETRTTIRKEMMYQFHSTGEERWLNASYVFVSPDLVMVHTEDITERKRAEDRIKAALVEKEVLLQEIHHRVKNNLQVVSNLLDLQSEHVHDIQILDMFKDCQNRISSMALVHERLYQSENLARIGIASYIRSLIKMLFDSFGVTPANVATKLDIEEVILDIDTALTCGLIINELVSNALKYAFPAGEQGEIGIVFHLGEDKQFTLIISDNGIGFPEDVDFRNTQSLGLQLVRMFTEQLDGTVELENNGGTTFKITFPGPKQEKKELI